MSNIVRSQVIGVTPGYRESMQARKEGARIEKRLEKQRRQWRLVPSNMTIILHQDMGALPGGVVLSVPHEVGRMILRRRLGSIIERDVTVDAVIDGSIEEAVDAMGMECVGLKHG